MLKKLQYDKNNADFLGLGSDLSSYQPLCHLCIGPRFPNAVKSRGAEKAAILISRSNWMEVIEGCGSCRL